MAKTAAATPPILKSSRRDVAEDVAAVGRGEDEDVSVVLLGFALGVVDDLIIELLCLVVVVDRVETAVVERGDVDVELSDTEEVPPIENVPVAE
jgi:hypothetical protein